MTAEPLRAPGKSDTAAIIELSALTKNSGSLTAVAGIDLTIHRGEVLALLVLNGTVEHH
jgi:ABC-type multidrug transport system ATPase subunit